MRSKLAKRSRLASLLCTALCSITLAGVLPAWAQEEAVVAEQAQNLSAKDWLARMQKAAVETNYRGTFVFSRGDMSSTVKILHRYEQGLEQERLTQLDGEMGEVFRSNAEVMCVLPNNRVVKVDQDKFSNRVVSAFSDFMPKHALYALETDGSDRLIGRSVQRISVKAQDQHRFNYFLWLDQATGLLLKSTVNGVDGSVLEHFHYSSIEFPETLTEAEINPIKQGAEMKQKMLPSAKKDRSWPGEINWRAAWLPEGYERINQNTQTGQNVLVYSDGLATFSVFVEPVESNLMPQGASIVGATVAYFHKVMTGEHHYGVTVLGEIPAKTAMMVAESVKPLMAEGTY